MFENTWWEHRRERRRERHPSQPWRSEELQSESLLLQAGCFYQTSHLRYFSPPFPSHALDFTFCSASLFGHYSHFVTITFPFSFLFFPFVTNVLQIGTSIILVPGVALYIKLDNSLYNLLIRYDYCQTLNFTLQFVFELKLLQKVDLSLKNKK